MGIIKLLIGLVIIIAISGIAFYFAPDSIKEKGLSLMNSQSFIPAEVKKAAEDIYATPQYKANQLLAELDKNFSALTTAVKNPTTDKTKQAETVQTIEQTKQLVQQLSQVKTDPTLISQITEAVT